MGKRNSRWLYGIVAVFVLITVCMVSVPATVYAQETQAGAEEENAIYDRLKEQIRTAWDEGMEMVEETNPIEISGNLAERLLRGIAAGLYKNLRSMKAGSLLIGGGSMLFGAVLAMLSRKNKKIRKMAVGVCMCAIPAILLVFVFGVSWYISFFQ